MLAARLPDPGRASSLADARRQLHHAAQFATALGISFIPPRADDSHTNLGWDDALGAFTSHPVAGPRGTVALATRAEDLALLVHVDGAVGSTVPLHGLTVGAAAAAIRAALAEAGLDAGRFTLRRHYEIPRHPVDDGAPFDASRHEDFEELGAWYALTAALLAEAARATPGASGVRVWPHHFDIATLVTVAPGRSSGAGLSPGDEYYDEPYFYVNAYPSPPASRLTARLGGGGHWHTHEWIGAVLPGSRLAGDPAALRDQARDFLRSAMAACHALARG